MSSLFVARDASPSPQPDDRSQATEPALPSAEPLVTDLMSYWGECVAAAEAGQVDAESFTQARAHHERAKAEAAGAAEGTNSGDRDRGARDREAEVFYFTAIGAFFGVLKSAKFLETAHPEKYPTKGSGLRPALASQPQGMIVKYATAYFAGDEEHSYLAGQAMVAGANVATYLPYNYLMLRLANKPWLAIDKDLFMANLAAPPIMALTTKGALALNDAIGLGDNPNAKALAEYTGYASGIVTYSALVDLHKQGKAALGTVPEQGFYQPVQAVKTQLGKLRTAWSTFRANPGAALRAAGGAPKQALAAGYAWLEAIAHSSRTWMLNRIAGVHTTAGRMETALGDAAMWLDASLEAGGAWLRKAWAGQGQDAARFGEFLGKRMGAIRLWLQEAPGRSIRFAGAELSRAGRAVVSSARAFWWGLRNPFSAIKNGLRLLGSVTWGPLKNVARGLLIRGGLIKALKGASPLFFLPFVQRLLAHAAVVAGKHKTGDTAAAAQNEAAKMADVGYWGDALAAGFEGRSMAGADVGASPDRHRPPDYDTADALQEQAAALGEIFELQNTFIAMLIDEVDVVVQAAGGPALQGKNVHELSARIETALPAMWHNLTEVVDIELAAIRAGAYHGISAGAAAMAADDEDRIVAARDQQRTAYEEGMAEVAEGLGS